MVTNSFGNRNFMQPNENENAQGSLVFFFLLVSFGLVSVCSQCVPIKFPMCSSRCSQYRLIFCPILFGRGSTSMYIGPIFQKYCGGCLLSVPNVFPSSFQCGPQDVLNSTPMCSHQVSNVVLKMFSIALQCVPIKFPMWPSRCSR